ncbi:MAG: DUF1929 domain-containing protein, partial [Planctomycetota bacterium]
KTASLWRLQLTSIASTTSSALATTPRAPSGQQGQGDFDGTVGASLAIVPPHGLIRDTIQAAPPLDAVWDGPGTPPVPPFDPPWEVDWLHEYPRLFSLSDGRLFRSGYMPRGAWLDHEVPGVWTQMAAQTGSGAPYSSNWANPRYDGSSVVINIPGLYDCVMRLGGSSVVPYSLASGTTSVEWSFGGAPWIALQRMPTPVGLADGARTHLNVLTLPTGAVLVMGGENNAGEATTSPMIFANGNWHMDNPNPNFSPRRYHFAMSLLDDGTIAIGGGDYRAYDYEVYKPYYTQLPASHKPVNLTFPTPPIFDSTYGAWELNYGSQYEIHCDPLDGDVKLEKAVLIPPGAMTHSSDMHHRYVELTTQAIDYNQVTFNMPGPTVEGVAPRGLYRLWLVTNTGAVSNALWVVLR